MFSDRQAQAWIVATAAQYIVDEGLLSVTSDVVGHIQETFANTVVPQALVDETISNLDQELQNV
jgi:hypothetical protein